MNRRAKSWSVASERLCETCRFWGNGPTVAPCSRFNHSSDGPIPIVSIVIVDDNGEEISGAKANVWTWADFGCTGWQQEEPR